MLPLQRGTRMTSSVVIVTIDGARIVLVVVVVVVGSLRLIIISAALFGGLNSSDGRNLKPTLVEPPTWIAYSR